ncbi:hypothetical protein G9A89_020886 [Geosiphon pyriformis]|nr:hypothetical protein G9A89_020886 [Geosiphon pyriformis]
MQAVTFHSSYSVEVKEVPFPKIIETTDVIVKVLVSSLCGSDLHVFRGIQKGQDKGTIMGHEFVGLVHEKGDQVNSLNIGDRVVSPFTTSCGQCFYCKKGITCRCEKGFFCAENGLGHLSEKERAESVVIVLGSGPVGLMSIVAALHLGAKKVFAIDRVLERLKLAQELGAKCLNFEKDDILEIIRKETDERGADVVLEVVGNNPALQFAFDLLRPAGVISSVGVHNSPTFPFSPKSGYDKNLTYKSGRCPVRNVIEKTIPLLQSKKYDVEKIISHRLPLADAPKAYNIFDNKLEGCTKVVFEFF